MGTALYRPDRRQVMVLAAVAAGLAGGFAEKASCSPASPVGGALPLENVAAGVFVYRAPYELLTPENAGAIANMSVIVGTESAAVIDTGNSRLAGEKMLAAVRTVTDRPVRYVVNTHMHPDHSLGNAAFVGDSVRFVAHHKMPRALSVRSDTYLAQVDRMLGSVGEGTTIVLPDLLVDGTMQLDLGGRVLTLQSHPTAHTDNDLTVLDGATGTWFLGDLLFVGHVPTLDGSIQGWLTLLDALARKEVTRAVPGHGPASVTWPQASAAERRYLDRIRTDVRALIAAGKPMGAAPGAAINERGEWALFDEFNARNAIAAYHELEWE